MLPIDLRFQSWKWRLWRKAPLIVLALMVALLLFLVVLGQRARAAPIPSTQEVFILQADNLTCFEKFLHTFKIDVKALSGIALGSDKERQAGTALTFVRCLDKFGRAYIIFVETKKGHVVKSRSYHCKAAGPEL